MQCINKKKIQGKEEQTGKYNISEKKLHKGQKNSQTIRNKGIKEKERNKRDMSERKTRPNPTSRSRLCFITQQLTNHNTVQNH